MSRRYMQMKKGNKNYVKHLYTLHYLIFILIVDDVSSIYLYEKIRDEKKISQCLNLFMFFNYVSFSSSSYYILYLSPDDVIKKFLTLEVINFYVT